MTSIKFKIQNAKWRPMRTVLLVCIFTFAFLIGAKALDVTFDPANLVQGPASNRIIFITPHNLVPPPPLLAVYDIIVTNTDSAGDPVVVPGMMEGEYDVLIKGPPHDTLLRINVPVNASGATNAYYLTLATPGAVFPYQQYAYSASASDARYLAATNLAVIVSNSVAFYINNLLALSFQPASANLTGFAAFSTNILGTFQPGSANLNGWTQIPTNALTITNSIIATLNNAETTAAAAQPGSANLNGWSGIATSSLNITNGIIATLNSAYALAAAAQVGSANLTGWSAIATNAFQITNFLQAGSASLSNWAQFATNILGTFQPLNANLTGWSAFLTNILGTFQLASANLNGWSALNTNLLSITNSLQIGSANLTNWSSLPTNVLTGAGGGQPANANLTNWANVQTNALGITNGIIATLNNAYTLAAAAQPGSANLNGWSLIPTNTWGITNGLIATLLNVLTTANAAQVGSANLTGWSAFATNILGTFQPSGANLAGWNAFATNILGTFQPSGANLAGWNAFLTNILGTFQPLSSTLTGWAQVPTNTLAITNFLQAGSPSLTNWGQFPTNILGTFQPSGANLAGWNAFLTNILGTFQPAGANLAGWNAFATNILAILASAANGASNSAVAAGTAAAAAQGTANAAQIGSPNLTNFINESTTLTPGAGYTNFGGFGERQIAVNIGAWYVYIPGSNTGKYVLQILKTNYTDAGAKFIDATGLQNFVPDIIGNVFQAPQNSVTFVSSQTNGGTIPDVLYAINVTNGLATVGIHWGPSIGDGSGLTNINIQANGGAVTTNSQTWSGTQTISNLTLKGLAGGSGGGDLQWQYAMTNNIVNGTGGFTSPQDPYSAIFINTGHGGGLSGVEWEFYLNQLLFGMVDGGHIQFGWAGPQTLGEYFFANFNNIGVSANHCFSDVWAYQLRDTANNARWMGTYTDTFGTVNNNSSTGNQQWHLALWPANGTPLPGSSPTDLLKVDGFGGVEHPGMVRNGYNQFTPTTTNCAVNWITQQGQGYFLTQNAFFYETNFNFGGNLTNSTTPTVDLFIYSGDGLSHAINFPPAWSNAQPNLPSVLGAGTLLKVTVQELMNPSSTNYAIALLTNNYTLTFDIDAANFIQVAALTNFTEKLAVNNLVVALKNQGLWRNCYDAIYPLRGTNATNWSKNLVNTNVYNLTKNGTVTAATNLAGIFSDGSTGFCDTGYNPGTATNINYAQNSAGIALYSKYNLGFNSAQAANMGVVDLTHGSMTWWSLSGTAGAVATIEVKGQNDNSSGTAGGSPTPGYQALNRTSSSAVNLVFGSDTQTSAIASTGVPNGGNIYLLTDDFGGIDRTSTNAITIAAIRRGMTPTEQAEEQADFAAFAATLGVP